MSSPRPSPRPSSQPKHRGLSKLNKALAELAGGFGELNTHVARMAAANDSLVGLNACFRDLLCALDLTTGCCEFPKMQAGAAAGGEAAARTVPARRGGRAAGGRKARVRPPTVAPGSAHAALLTAKGLPPKYRSEAHRERLCQILEVMQQYGQPLAIADVVNETGFSHLQSKEYMNALVRIRRVVRSRAKQGFEFALVGAGGPAARRRK